MAVTLNLGVEVGEGTGFVLVSGKTLHDMRKQRYRMKERMAMAAHRGT
jgi:hypothetical protein